MEKKNIQTRVFFLGNILRQPMYNDILKKGEADNFPSADNIMRNGVLLPLHHGMTDEIFSSLNQTIDEFISTH